MILRKYTSLIGIGSAQIDLVLPKDTFKQGEEIKGHFLIKGGITEQQILQIDCDLIRIDHTTNEETIFHTITLPIEKSIDKDKEEKRAFSYILHPNIPVSTSKTSYGFRTKMTFNQGVVSTDIDYIRIV
ncbi:sporulation protein [Bacillus suaedae]|uniref:Sporulation protein n=1 Tax=Halalkalibacter suaedae TaxID=2822140 RepID=A0A940WVK3_9BACI|nr:sporulation protein [Bacillus suaedae]MBP3953210.1 sporulation protein [Bacillus suaedae]